MLKNVFLIFTELIVVMSILVPKNHNTSTGQLERQDDDFNTNEEGVTTGNETLFWTTPDSEDATETEVQETSQPENDVLTTTEENVKEPTVTNADEPINDQTPQIAPQVLDESITLQRNKCHAEIAIHENSNTKLELKFGDLSNNSHGTCHITLTGRENVMLGVVISNIHLYRNNTLGEVLKVFVGDRYSAFVLKEYYGYNDYEPLLLTETNKVYLILYYNVDHMSPSRNYSHFNLEVFTYRKYENNVDYKEQGQNYNNFYYSSEETPYFTPYIYNRIY